MAKSFRWTVEYVVDETWVADGFELTAARALEMLSRELPSAYGQEFSARIMSAPKPEAIKAAQAA